MKFSGVAAFAALAGLASATDHWQSVWCTDNGNPGATVTVTQTVTAGGAGPSDKPMSSSVATNSGVVTSVDYGMSTTSIYLPSAGTYANPYGGSSITVGKATWTTVSIQFKIEDVDVTNIHRPSCQSRLSGNTPAAQRQRPPRQFTEMASLSRPPK